MDYVFVDSINWGLKIIFKNSKKLIPKQYSMTTIYIDFTLY